MYRGEILLRGIQKDMLGVEVGPYFAPLVPKRKGYRSLALDVFDKERLLANAAIDPNIAKEDHTRIEDVDLVGGATDIASLIEAKGLLGQIDYVVSSHNFEHLPNPIQFLLGCQEALTPNGFVSMAVPDRRGSFDYFRPVSTTADFLRAFHDESDRPTLAQVFALTSAFACRTIDGKDVSSWDWNQGGENVRAHADVNQAYKQYASLLSDPDRDYVDSHCSVFTKSSFELIIRDLHYLHVIDLGIDWLEGPSGCEFYARLKKGVPVPSKDAFHERRAALLQQVVDEAADNTRAVNKDRQKLAELQRKTDDQAARLDEINSSLSWKITAPFRDLRRRLTGR